MPSTFLVVLRAGELGPVGDIGRAAEHRLVARDQCAVLGRDQIGLDEVGAHLDGLRRPRGVLGQIAAGAAVGGDERPLAVQGLLRCCRGAYCQPGTGNRRGGRRGSPLTHRVPLA